MQPHPYLPPNRPAVTQPALTRYSSAPAGSAYLSALVDSVIAGSALPAEFHGAGTAGPDHLLQTSSGHGSSTVGGGFFQAEHPSFRSTGALDPPLAPAARPYDPLDELQQHHISAVTGDLGAVGGHDSSVVAVTAAGPSQPSSSLLFRHNSSPAGVFNQLLMDEHGFSVAARAGGGLGTYQQQPGGLPFHGGSRKLRSQLSYPSRQDSLSSISEISMPNVVGASGNTHSGSDFQVGGSWDDAGAMGFRGNSSIGLERQLSRDGSGDFMSALDDMDSPFNLPGSSLEMAAMEQLLHIQQDTVACKARRTRISEKLKKLQELVPNMDKQTNTADMLDLAVQHIKGLQIQVQKLNEEHSNCVCSRPGPYGL